MPDHVREQEELEASRKHRLQQIATLEDQEQQLEEQIAALQQELEDGKRQQRKADETRGELEMQLQGAQSSISLMSKELEEAETGLRAMENKAEELMHQHKQLAEDHDALTKHVEEVRCALSDSEAQKQGIEASFARMSAEMEAYTEKSFAEMEATSLAHASQIEDMKTMAADARAQHDAAITDLSQRLHREVEQHNKDVALLEANLTRMKTDYEADLIAKAKQVEEMAQTLEQMVQILADSRGSAVAKLRCVLVVVPLLVVYRFSWISLTDIALIHAHHGRNHTKQFPRRNSTEDGDRKAANER